MTSRLRWVLIVMAWLFAALLCSPSQLSRARFGPDEIAINAGSTSPVFKKTAVNAGQALPMVHVASLATLPVGIEAAVWYGGSKECAPDVKIYFSESEHGGGWSAPRVIMTREHAEHDLQRPLQGLGNAVLLSGPDGSLRLLFVTIAMGRWSGSQLNTCLSKDGGITWSSARRLTLSPFFNFSDLVRNRAISLAGGGWCVPIYQEFLGKFPELLWLKESKGHLDYCKSRIAGGCSTFQPSVVPLDDARAIAFLRDYTDNRKVFISRSDDGGCSWSRPVASQLPNPDAGISGLKLSDGKLLLAYNDSSECRDNLALALSRDEGKTWEKLATLEQEPGSSFSYPFLIRSEGGLINLAYTRKGTGIALTEFNEEWVADILSSLSRSKITVPQQ